MIQVFTGILLADMVLAGDVSLHDTLDKFLPEAAGYPESVRAITLLQLATHASGLPRLPGNLAFGMKDPSNPYAHYGSRELQAFLYGYTPPPGQPLKVEKYVYGAQPYSAFKEAIDSMLR